MEHVFPRRKVDQIRDVSMWVNGMTTFLTSYLFLSRLHFDAAAEVFAIVVSLFVFHWGYSVMYSLGTPHMRRRDSRLFLYDQHKLLKRVTVVELHDLRRIERRSREVGGVSKLIPSDEWVIETSSESHSLSPPHGDREFTSIVVGFLEQIMPVDDVRDESAKQEISAASKDPGKWEVTIEGVFLFLSVGLLGAIVWWVL